MTQWGFFLNLGRCTGCHTCEITCKEQNDLGAGPRWRRVRTVEGGTYPNPFAYFIAMSCNHCADPACVRACPAAAYTKRADGLVIHDPEQCMGCRYCTFACPYGAPQYDEVAGRVGKCSGCYQLVDQGKEPACVASCPMRALEFGPLEELKTAHPEAVDQLPVLPDRSLTQPSVLLAPRKATAASPRRIIDGVRVRPLGGGPA
ncbi:MAG: 4Fe-4S dicluster domain-containing protein [Mycobacterium leprae]